MLVEGACIVEEVEEVEVVEEIPATLIMTSL
jgi:hypothetical protein